MVKTSKVSAIRSRIGEIPFLFVCLAVWVVLFSVFLSVAGYWSYLPGFLLGAAGSVLYGVLLYRRVPALLNRPFSPETVLPPSNRLKDNLKQLWWGWAKTLQPIMAIALIILAFSRFFQNLSFPAALFGFVSFQISLFLYASLISIDQ